LVGGGDDLELFGRLVIALVTFRELNDRWLAALAGGTYEPTPTTPLDRSSDGVHLLFKLVDAPEVSNQSLLEGTIGELSTIFACWRKILPKEGMIDVTSSVEFQRGLQSNQVLGTSSLMQGILCRVQTIHVGLVVFGMVKLHDLLRDVWFEGLNAQPDPTC
jgi:hypothetical protein